MDVIYKLPKENGGASAEGCIRYDQEQELNDEQKQQARENIGALPEVITINITGLENSGIVPLSQEDIENMGITAELMEAAMAGKVLIRVTCDALEMETNVINMEPFAIPEAMGEYYALKGDSSRIMLLGGASLAGFFTIFFYVAKDMSVGYALDNYYDPQIPECYVSYGESQSLTDNQKLIACSNIGAAQSKTFSFSKKISEITTSEFNAIVDAISSGKQVSVRCEYQEWNNDYIDHFFVIKYGKKVINSGGAPAGATNKYIYLLKDGRTLIELNTSYMHEGVGYVETPIPCNPSDKTITIKQGGVTKGSFTLNQGSNGTINLDAGGVQADWNETDTDDPAFIKNKPTIPTANNPAITIKQGGTTKGSFTLNQATDKIIDLDAGGVQSDWNETDSTDPAYIKNKPTIPQSENHQVLTDAPESDISCPAETKTQLCSLTIPEDGVYQISAAALRVKLGSMQPNAMVNLELVFSDESESRPVASQFLHDRAGCIGIAANLHRNTTVKLFATCGEACTISRTTDKQRLTYLNAVRIGAIYSE